ncbi:MAC/perforin domain-containing protein [Sphingobacterium siyangense]|jgi:hypothetical protein|uniref:MAC/perforin domain-containing protein n=1 Tax=Sphingobacterium siyangense TaxID=459529 RepID=UPI0028B121B7|nr:MAC/perforin domain-containing protein [Sphingobacterium siyangense]
MKRINLIYILTASTFLFTNCKKNEIPTNNLPNNNLNHKASGGDGKWDVLGYGYDATQDMLITNSMSDVSIFNISQFAVDFQDKNDASKVIGIDVNSVTGGSYDVFTGYSAYEYTKSVNNKKSYGGDGNVSIPFATDAGDNNKQLLNFKGNFSKNDEDSNTTAISSRFSYATFEMWHRVKRIRFTQDVTTATLLTYLTPEFKNYVATKTATEIVNRYGTHVLLDISLGSRVRINYSGEAKKETSEVKKVSTIKAGIGASVLNMFGININADKTKEEVTKLTNETSQRHYNGKYYGGNNTGTSISFDSEGKPTSNFNLASWQQGVTDRNAALISIDRSMFIYDFIADPTKKAQVKAAVEKHIKDNQITELGEVPIYVYNNKKTTDHYFSTENEPSISGGQYINEGIVFYAFKEQKQGTVPVYTYFSKGQSAHYLSTSNQPSIKGSYLNEGIIFYAYNQFANGRSPVYAYSGVYGGDYYFTTENQPTLGNGGYRNEGVAFYGVKTD